MGRGCVYGCLEAGYGGQGGRYRRRARDLPRGPGRRGGGRDEKGGRGPAGLTAGKDKGGYHSIDDIRKADLILISYYSYF